MNTAILVVTLFTLWFSARWLRKVLSSGNPVKIIEKREKQLEEFKELVKESGNGFYLFAWVLSALISSSFLATSIYVLTQTLNFNLN